MANALENLLKQYTDNLSYDPRTFSTDVLSQEQFQQPFDAWTQNAINTYLLPDFLRYQYDPAMQQLQSGLYNANQRMGTSGAWRTAQGQSELSNMAQEALRQQEQLGTQFNDQALQTRNAFQQAWSDPLYRQQMEQFYNAPWADYKLGDVGQPTGQVPELTYNTQLMPSSYNQMTPFSGGLTQQYMGDLGQKMQQNKNIFGSYMTPKARLSNNI